MPEETTPRRGRSTGVARLDQAISRIAGAAVADGLCEAVVLKGSIGRGDADEFSDVDLYLVVSPQNRDVVLGRRNQYLAANGDVVFVEDVDFGLPQVPSRFLRTFRQPHRPAVRCGYPSSRVTSR